MSLFDISEENSNARLGPNIYDTTEGFEDSALVGNPEPDLRSHGQEPTRVHMASK